MQKKKLRQHSQQSSVQLDQQVEHRQEVAAGTAVADEEAVTSAFACVVFSSPPFFFLVERDINGVVRDQEGNECSPWHWNESTK